MAAVAFYTLILTFPSLDTLLKPKEHGLILPVLLYSSVSSLYSFDVFDFRKELTHGSSDPAVQCGV